MALGAPAMPHDLDAEQKPRIRYRCGVGCVRHLHTPALWIHRHVLEGRVVEEGRRRSERRRLGDEACRCRENVGLLGDMGIGKMTRTK